MEQGHRSTTHETNQATETPNAALERIRQERLTNPSKPPKVSRKVSLNALHVEPLVFQVRADGLDMDRVEVIAKGLDGTEMDDPVDIWWSGQRLIVIEGHHRHAAYKLKAERDAVTLKVPVKAHFEKSLLEAMGAAGVLNNRDKISISKPEMLDNAWRMVCMKEGSIAETAKASGISESQISNMRKVLVKLEGRSMPHDQMINSGWRQCREWANGKVERDFTPSAIEATAQALAKELSGVRTVSSLVNVPDILARAIEIMSPELSSRMIQSEPFWNALNTDGRAMLAEFDAENEDKDVDGDTEISDF